VSSTARSIAKSGHVSSGATTVSARQRRGTGCSKVDLSPSRFGHPRLLCNPRYRAPASEFPCWLRHVLRQFDAGCGSSRDHAERME